MIDTECEIRNLQCLPESTNSLQRLDSWEAEGVIRTGKLGKIIIFVNKCSQINKVTTCGLYSGFFEIRHRRRLPLFLKTWSAFDCHAAVYGRAVSCKCSSSIGNENTQFCNGVENPVFKNHLSIYTGLVGCLFFWQFHILYDHFALIISTCSLFFFIPSFPILLPA